MFVLSLFTFCLVFLSSSHSTNPILILTVLKQEDITTILSQDLATAVSCIHTHVPTGTIQLSDNQFGALVDWAFNLGCRPGAGLLIRLNKGDDPGKKLVSVSRYA